MNYRVPRNTIVRRAVLATVAVLALRVYFVQELIAAFFIFSVLFVCVAAVVLAVFVMDHAGQIAFARVEAIVRALIRPARPGQISVNRRATAGMLTPVHDRRGTTGK